MIQITDIDGSTPGRAALLIVALDRPDQTERIDYAEGPECQNPLLWARKLEERVLEEMPGMHTAVIADSRARYLEWRAAAQGWGHNLLTPGHYLATRPWR